MAMSVADSHACGSTPFTLQVSMSEAMTAQFSVPASSPAKRAFLRFRAMGRIMRSAVLDAAVGQEAPEAIAVFVDVVEDRGGAILPDGQLGGGVTASDLSLYGLEIADEGHAILGNRRGSGAGYLDQFAARMCPAIGTLDARTDPVRSD